MKTALATLLLLVTGCAGHAETVKACQIAAMPVNARYGAEMLTRCGEYLRVDKYELCPWYDEIESYYAVQYERAATQCSTS